MPIGTALHEKTFPLCESLNYREWSGYYAVSAYEAHHEHEYNAIRNAAALIDVTPLFKYRLTGRDATKLVDRLITRDMRKVSVGQVLYTPWCDEHGKVIDDGTVTRLAENTYRWTAADPSLRWFTQNAAGMDVAIEDISERVAAIALQGPTSGRLLASAAEADIAGLKYFRVTTGTIAGIPVDISRTGYTGDLGYEIWMPWIRRRRSGMPSWRPAARSTSVPRDAGARRGADRSGPLLIDVDFHSSKKALIEAQKYPLRNGPLAPVQLEKEHFAARRRSSRRRVGAREGSPDSKPTDGSRNRSSSGRGSPRFRRRLRVAVPVYRQGNQIGRATRRHGHRPRNVALSRR